jgi:site-specific DNA-methyltransferase (adenine-specific)
MSYQIHHGDNREVLKNLADNSIDSVVTDPPYELGFMGKSWDATGVAYSVELWQEVMRVLKPGGHLLAFSGSRTYHRMAVAIEDAGFEIRDQIMWIYGSGFPKSHDVSKGIDKQAGAEREVVGVAGKSGSTRNAMNGDFTGGEYMETLPSTNEAKQWQGWGTALKPAHEPIVVARKPLIGTVAANVLTYGTGGLNIDGARVGNEEIVTTNGKGFAGSFEGGVNDNGGSTHQGRWPANVIHDGSDEVVELFPTNTNISKGVRGRGSDIYANGKGFANTLAEVGQDIGYGDSGSAARFFYCAKASKRDRNEGLDGFELKQTIGGGGLTVVGGAYGSIKAPGQNHHPTVKPTELMRYLCRLVTPPGGIVLDPFMGSGSTGKAAMYEGFEFVGIELTDEYLPIAKARIEFAIEEMKGRLL